MLIVRSLAQGLLPTMMITYVGLDLGVDTAVLTNSVAPKIHLRQSRVITAFSVGEDLEAVADNGSENVNSDDSESAVLDITKREDC